jgi:WD40 repeat protein
LKFSNVPKKFKDKSKSSNDISFSSGGSYLAAANKENKIQIYFLNENEPRKLYELNGHASHVNLVQFSRKLTRILSDSSDGIVTIWNHESNEWKFKQIDVSVNLDR